MAVNARLNQIGQNDEHVRENNEYIRQNDTLTVIMGDEADEPVFVTNFDGEIKFFSEPSLASAITTVDNHVSSSKFNTVGLGLLLSTNRREVSSVLDLQSTPMEFP
jgi:hypothetical protein